ncbi:MAG: methyltransferase domain-containing protein [Chloroflexi bacterium]|nr:methyltransferase domain-containing protein [Ktedonobacteraceae bacterium]MBV9708296.1 methyltransferase domain-containing protein [Chloroflexota bacterium]
MRFENPFQIFKNPFVIEDLLVFDNATLQRLLSSEGFHLTIEDVAHSLYGTSKPVIAHIACNLPLEQRAYFQSLLQHPLTETEVKAARQRILDNLFWELIYWKAPELYDELTDGEQLHPGIFQQLESDVRDKVVLDAAAGTGRVTFECLRHRAELIYAVDPAPGLLHLLSQKLASASDTNRVIIRRGCFEQLPLENDSVDISLSCSAFSSKAGRGGERGLAEFWRVTKVGGKIILIWPNPYDYDWLVKHGFRYVTFPLHQEAYVRFRSLESALRCLQLFYADNRAAAHYILERQQPEVPFSLLGFEQPHDYCWLTVK